VFIDDRVVLVRRRHEPLAGQWSLPGGAIELGETLGEGLRRELREEIGIETRVGPLVELFDRITRDDDGRVRFHYVLADYLCQHVSGELRPGSDAGAVALADPAHLSPYAVTATVTAVIHRAITLRALGTKAE
jgi:ADP-ribose pyrophosphatase YjhB (NUDIX family)